MSRLSQPSLMTSAAVDHAYADQTPFLGVTTLLRDLGGPKQPFAMLLLEIDRPAAGQARFDDTTGERLIQLAALRARRIVGDCVVARLGASRLVVLLEGPVDEIAAVAITGRLHDALRGPFDVAHTETFVTTSIGIGLGDWNTEPATVLRHSERALERVRANGGDATAVEPGRRLFELACESAA